MRNLWCFIVLVAYYIRHSPFPVAPPQASPMVSSSSSIPLHSIQNPLLPLLRRSVTKPSPPLHLLSRPRSPSLRPSAKLRLSEIMGGRGLCNGEEGLLKELTRPAEAAAASAPPPPPPPPPTQLQPSPLGIDDGAFEKELLGLTGGFPGGEKGLRRFIEENPPPRKGAGDDEEALVGIAPGTKGPKPRAPELPLFLPGMIVIVKNPKNPFYMYCGIVQRVTDGKVGVLFEGGNWDRLITFRLDELERRDKGPPMVNPKSAVLESIVTKSA
ncbi:NAD(P)H-quinone oxidoreductase subunit S, chloroplastic [Ananas comosus]|uniref:NAD(P)H-quinone oxidoreductase subunit S, chloroplastic n=1 Tax=Ananas comosus TaxID=4615 RepID=A0A6P5G4J2_ANACO|nr:NAD(P)H-quinone oxidoreductase subunit S, chloroplastic [Ananas comosus]